MPVRPEDDEEVAEGVQSVVQPQLDVVAGARLLPDEEHGLKFFYERDKYSKSKSTN